MCSQKRGRSSDTLAAAASETAASAGTTKRPLHPAVMPFGWFVGTAAAGPMSALESGSDDGRSGNGRRDNSCINLDVASARRVKRFACSVCEYRCSEKSKLIEHERVHSGEKPFACSQCEYRCFRKSSLVRHERVHIVETYSAWYSCEWHCSNRSEE